MEKNNSEIVLVGDSFTTGYFNNTPLSDLLGEVTDKLYTQGGIYLHQRTDLKQLVYEEHKKIILFSLNVEVLPRPVLKIFNLEIHPKYYCLPANKNLIKILITKFVAFCIKKTPALYYFKTK